MPFLTNKILILDNGRYRRIQPTDDLEMSGQFKASYLYGDGSNLTNLNASELKSGSILDSLLSTNVAKYGDATPTFTNTVKANKFDGDGSLLTSLPAGQVTGAGALSDTVLSTNIPRLNAIKNDFAGDMTVQGSMTVEGDFLTKSRTSLIVGDNFIDLLAGNTDTAIDEAGGFTVNARAVTGTVRSATDFVAADGPNNAYLLLLTDPVGTYQTGDVIQVTSTADGRNDGQYVVLSVDSADNRVTIKGTGATGIAAWTPFVHKNFVPQTLQNAFISKVNLAVVSTSNGHLYDVTSKLIPVGTLACNYQEAATEASFQNTWINLDAAAVITLQIAYNNGSLIETTTAKGDFRVQPAALQTAGFALQGNSASSLKATDGATLTVGDSTLASPTEMVGRITLPSGGTLMTEQESTSGDQYEIIYFKDSVDKGTPAAASVTDIVPIGPRATATRASTIYGSKVVIKTTGAVTAGSRMYLSATPGAARVGAPASGEIWLLGKCEEVLPGDLCTLTWTPQYITTVP